MSSQAQELKKFRWLFYLLVPAFSVGICYALFGERYFNNLELFAVVSLVTTFITLILSATQIFIAYTFRKWMDKEESVLKRLLVSAVVYLPVTAAFVTGIFLFYDWIRFYGYEFRLADYRWGLLVGVVCDMIGMAMNEGIYGYSKWRETKLEAEQLQKEMLQTQLNSLLQQINPHFLFNSLNSLSTLIDEDPRQAQRFLSDMSKVYRYLLRTNEHELTTVTTELKFIDSYFHLLQTRFGMGVLLQTDIVSEDLNWLLPPLTLQLLLENAVKHNIVSKQKPLVIEICSRPSHQLEVRNNLQRKRIRMESSRVGLANIAEKYRLINRSTIQILEDENSFSVIVPLIAPSGPLP